MSSPEKNLVARATEAGWEESLVINPRTGNLQIRWNHNDVWNAVDVAGGVEVVAKALGVEEIDVQHWIDDHYVPARYVKDLCRLSGFSEWSIQKPPFEVEASVGSWQPR